MNNSYINNKLNIIFMLIIILLIFQLYLYNTINFNAENLSVTGTSSDTAQSLSSAFNYGNATLNNLNVLGNITVGNAVISATDSSISAPIITATSKLTSGNFVINASDTNVLLGNITADNVSINKKLTAGVATLSSSDGSFTTSGNIYTTGAGNVGTSELGSITAGSQFKIDSEGTINMPNSVSIKTFNDGHWEFGKQNTVLFYSPNGKLRQFTGDYADMSHIK